MSEQTNKTKVMGMTDASLKSGFGIEIDGILRGLSTVYDAYLLGWGFHYEETVKRNGYTLIPTGNHPCGADCLPQVLQQLKPEVLITQADTRMLMGWYPNGAGLAEMLKGLAQRPTWIFYPVVDGHIWQLDNQQNKWPSNWTNVIKQADVVVTMTDYGKRILEASGVPKEKLTRIYHGIDTTLFRPLLPEEKLQIKKNLGIGDKFIVGGVFKNIVRKNPEKYLQAFQIFRQGKEDKVALMLHTNPQPQAAGEFDLAQQAQDIGLTIGKDIFFSTIGIPIQFMPQIYNAMDVFWALGGLESFCVPVAEAMACGIPMVALNGNVYPELTAGSCLLADVPTYPDSHGCPVTQGSYNGVEGLNCNPYEVAKRTEQYYQSKQLREKASYKEIERAVTTFDWPIIQEQWRQLVKKYVVSEEELPQEWQELLQETKQ